MLKVLDLFSGIGGFSLGLERTGGFETVAFCEIEEFPRKVLAKHWPDVPCHNDVRELTADAVGHIDVICGGYPCQPFSTAGQRKGAEDDRHLWPEVKRLMATVRPTWGVFENVAGHISMGLDQVLSDLEGEGYTAWPLVIPACAVDAPHRRDRVWILAHSKSVRHREGREERNIHEAHGRQVSKRGAITSSTSEPTSHMAEVFAHCESDRRPIGGAGNIRRGVTQKGGQGSTEPIGTDTNHRTRFMADSNNARRQQQWRTKSARTEQQAAECGSRWIAEPNVGRVAHGVPRRVDRLKGLGNAVVPQVVTMLGHAILEAENEG